MEDGTIIDSPAIAMKKRVGYVSKDRDVESLCLNASIEDNISIAGMSEFAIKKFLILRNQRKKICESSDQRIVHQMCGQRSDRYHSFPEEISRRSYLENGSAAEVRSLFWTVRHRGVDIGVKQAMYQLMVKLKNEGKSILMISEELPELIGMSDRILIMKDGEITKEFERSEELSDSQIIEYMI